MPARDLIAPVSAGECLSAQARVRRAQPDSTVQLELIEPPRCSGCAGWCVLRRRAGAALRIRSPVALQPDDLVTLSIDRRHLLRGALVLHGLPWAGLVAGAVAGVASIGGDPGALLGALAGLAAGALLARRGQGRWRIAPVIARAERS